MKKVILKIFGVVALAAGMMYNIQLFDSENSLDISLAALGNMAVAQGESSGSGGGYNNQRSVTSTETITYMVNGRVCTTTATIVVVHCEGEGTLHCTPSTSTSYSESC